MSCTLYWKKVVNTGKRIGDVNLRNKIEDRFGLPCILNNSHLDYLEGLKDCGIEDADNLIKLIEKYGEIEMYKEC